MASGSQKARLDVTLVRNGLVESRNKAKQVIESGKVSVNGQICKEPSRLVSPFDNIEVLETPRYVSRAGYKIEGLFKNISHMEDTEIEIRGKVICDIGSSTGGFVDFFIQNGALKVYAVDVNTEQLHPKLRSDERVKLIQKNAKELSFEDLREFVDIVSTDVSFISVRKIKKTILNLLKPGGYGIILIKPQFEVGYSHRGVIKDKPEHVRVLREVVRDFIKEGFKLVHLDFSRILGGDGNIEFFAVFQKCLDVSLDKNIADTFLDSKIVEVVNDAWEELG
ncbi:TlyA family RNA methyltransferase [Fervidobacterium pennivorans subsp. shakshaketiis]|jgi:23S rRNA (cytidine1920-2'-O)/16S rRNA (cytidine1409-2'-O)-methyltransferase|uniref:Hemolysin A n=1 Tax=Fervidobacterium pennivorans (strain DSM 9078 / Ven5) TaxID=771875 RepID=H9UAS1_FERPD|nr:TlyA family RNA methyltransferase [Fervidobacterium pennivorans]AFG34614.1 hemolysin A [Fervidobacterium pennivorans DSM 9078]QIV77939.1 TlyA family RNA methyltransferase [Fervidobacterium pennivorans subsp. keratinolyticus]